MGPIPNPKEKYIFFLILIICNIYYTFEYYEDKDMDISTCTSHVIEDNSMECFITYEEGNEENKSCMAFFNNPNILKKMKNISSGYQKEYLSKSKLSRII